ncbi:substrate-binding protein domain-containing protein, partial [Acetomicrobium thermoterrenum DSM 13490]
KQPANSERALGMQVMENILTSNPDLDAVFCTNDEMALGALQAAEAAGKKIIIVGFDANKDALESIIDNGLTATIAQNPFAMGLYGVENAIKLLNGEEIPKKIDTGTTLVTIDNAKEFLKQKEELSL